MTSPASVLRQLRLRLTRRLRPTSVGTRTALLCLVGIVFIVMMTISSQPRLNKSDAVVKYDNIDDVLRSRQRQSRISQKEEKQRYPGVTPSPIDTVRLTAQLERLAATELQPRNGVYKPHSGCSSSADVSPLPENFEEPMRWQPVSASEDNGYVFSAHLDLRYNPSPAVVVFGVSIATYGGSSTGLYCRIWYREVGGGKFRNYISSAETRYSYESHGRKYTASFHVCHLRDKALVPYAVSVITDPCNSPKSVPNLLKVITSQLTPSEMTSPGVVNFTVCVTPFNYRYNRADQLAEMIEVNRMYGAQRFIFYNYSSGENVTHLLDSYRKWHGADLIEVIQWPLPMPVDVWPRDPAVTPEIHYFAQLAALNDCLYRSIGRSTFVVNTDLDEFVVPRRRDSWVDLLDDVTSSEIKPDGTSLFPAVYMMKNVFFRTDWPKDKTFLGSKLITLETTEREQNIFDFNMRSKIIAWTKAAWMVGVHAAVELCSNCETVYVGENDALLHHYRLWEDDPNRPRPPSTVDRRMHQYADVIRRRTENVHKLANI